MQPYYLYSLIRELNKYYTIRGYATVGHGQRHRKLPWSHMDMHGVSVWTSEAQCKHSERFTNVAAGPPRGDPGVFHQRGKVLGSEATQTEAPLRRMSHTVLYQEVSLSGGEHFLPPLTGSVVRLL